MGLQRPTDTIGCGDVLTATHLVEELRINEADGGITFEVRVAPRARRTAIKGIEAGVLKVALTAAPVEGAANVALVKLLAKVFGVSKSRVRIVRGERARNKVVCVVTDRATVCRVLECTVPGQGL